MRRFLIALLCIIYIFYFLVLFVVVIRGFWGHKLCFVCVCVECMYVYVGQYVREYRERQYVVYCQDTLTLILATIRTLLLILSAAAAVVFLCFIFMCASLAVLIKLNHYFQMNLFIILTVWILMYSLQHHAHARTRNKEAAIAAAKEKDFMIFIK